MNRTSCIKAVIYICALLCQAVITSAVADGIRVAVASNFTAAIKEISGRFERQSGHKVILVFGSTGKHYAQIKNGAPFEVYFAADANKPKLLEAEGVAQPGSRFTYAIGKLVLWSPKVNVVDPEGNVLEQSDFRHLAFANPKLAPYGMAAREVLQRRGLWQALQNRFVRGENIAQTFQFVKSGNADLGFVSWSQIKRPHMPVAGSWWEIPQSLYTPIEQQAVLLKDNAVARAFLAFIRSEEALKIIRSYGYGTP